MGAEVGKLAGVQGVAVGIGMTMLLYFDYVVADDPGEDARPAS